MVSLFASLLHIMWSYHPLYPSFNAVKTGDDVMGQQFQASRFLVKSEEEIKSRCFSFIVFFYKHVLKLTNKISSISCLLVYLCLSLAWFPTSEEGCAPSPLPFIAHYQRDYCEVPLFLLFTWEFFLESFSDKTLGYK